MSHKKEQAKTAGYKRGLEGKLGSANVTQGWGDDAEDRAARREGHGEGRREYLRQKAEKSKD